MVEDCPAGRVFDDQLKQLHGGVGQASRPAASTRKMTRCSGSFAKSPRTRQLIPSLFVRGPDLLGHREGRARVGGSAGLLTVIMSMYPAGRGDEAAVNPGRSGVPGEGATNPKLGDRLPGADPE